MSDANNTLSSEQQICHPDTISSSMLDGIQGCEDVAWARVSRLYAPLVYFWCRRQGLQASDAEDIVQEVFRTVVSRVGEFEHNRLKGSFRGWLRTITRHKLGDFIRSERRRKETPRDAPLWESLASSDGEEEPDEGELLEEIRVIYGRVVQMLRTDFDEHTWRAFLRIVEDGASPSDVAVELEMSVEAVYQAKSRILRRIRDELRDLGV